jgi:hypothetical protein
MTTINSIPNALIYATDPSGVLNIQTNSTTALSIASNSQVAIANTMYVANSTTFATNVSMPNTFGFKNRIINGAMGISQRGTSFTAAAGSGGFYCLDRWLFDVGSTSSSAYTIAQSTSAPTGFYNSLGITVTTSSSISSGYYSFLAQNIEANNVYDLGYGTANAKTTTLSFWVNCSSTGTFGVGVQNYNNSYSYIATYTISSANTWTYVTLTIPGCTTGTWNSGNAGAFFVVWDIQVGTSQSTSTTNSWISGNYLGYTGGTKLGSISGATFYITGVQLEVGTQATPFDYRDYGNELRMCQRYYYQDTRAFSISSQGTATNGQTYPMVTFPLPVSMRTAPTAGPNGSTTFTGLTAYNSQTLNAQWGYSSGTSTITVKMDNPATGAFSLPITAAAEL